MPFFCIFLFSFFFSFPTRNSQQSAMQCLLSLSFSLSLSLALALALSLSLSLSRSLSLSLSPLVLSPSTFIMLHHFSRMPSPCCIVSVQLLNVFSPLFIVSQHCSSLIALPVPTLEQIPSKTFKYIYVRKTSFFESQDSVKNSLKKRLKKEL